MEPYERVIIEIAEEIGKIMRANYVETFGTTSRDVIQTIIFEGLVECDTLTKQSTSDLTVKNKMHTFIHEILNMMFGSILSKFDYDSFLIEFDRVKPLRRFEKDLLNFFEECVDHKKVYIPFISYDLIYEKDPIQIEIQKYLMRKEI